MAALHRIAHFAAVLAPRVIAPHDVAMVIAYHCIFGMYGFWLPNDPRGSGSDYVASWELFRYGPARKTRGANAAAKWEMGRNGRTDVIRRAEIFRKILSALAPGHRLKECGFSQHDFQLRSRSMKSLINVVAYWGNHGLLAREQFSPRAIARTCLLLAGLALASVGQAAVITQVDLSPFANARIQNYQPSAAGYPEGMVTLGGVPFNIQAVGGNNAWNAEFVPGPQPHVLNIGLNIPNATEAYSLINTFYGQPGPASYVKVEFFGTGGAYFGKDLIGNVDVRDHFNAFWTNTINGTSTVNVYSSGGGFLQESRLDMQKYLLPASFLGQTLTGFRLTSTGGVGISDASIQGLTILSATAVPEPASLTLFGMSALGLCAARVLSRRRVNHP